MAETKVQVRIDADDKASAKLKGIGANMQRMGATFRKVGIGMAAAGIAIAGGLFAMAKKTADAGDEIAKMAKRTGFATEALSELKHVAELSGTELGSIEKATKRMSKAIIDAGDGLETYTRAFDKLGLNIADLMAMSPEEQFWAISSALADLEDHTLKVAIAQEVFGRAGTQLLPMLEEGAEGIAAMRQEAHDLGIIFDEEAAREAEEFKDSLTRLETSLQGVGKELIDTLMPQLTIFAEKTVDVIKDVKDWIEANPKLVSGLKLLVGVLVGGGGVLLAFSAISKAIIAVNAALIIMHSLTGIGLLKVGLGLAAAAGMIIGMKELIGGGAAAPKTDIFGEPFRPGPLLPPEPKGILGFEHGGIVPGPVGKPIPIIAHGGEPFGGIGGEAFGDTIINVTVQGSVLTEDKLSDVIYERLLRRKERNNTLELS